MAENELIQRASAVLTTKQAAERIGISVAALNRMRRRGCGPSSLCVNSRTYRYGKLDLEQWIEGRTLEGM